MCNINPIDRRLEQQIVATGLSIISKAMEASLSANQPQQPTDVLTAATTDFQLGMFSKAQYFAVINARYVPTTVQTTAYVQRTGSIIRR